MRDRFWTTTIDEGQSDETATTASVTPVTSTSLTTTSQVSSTTTTQATSEFAELSPELQERLAAMCQWAEASSLMEVGQPVERVPMGNNTSGVPGVPTNTDIIDMRSGLFGPALSQILEEDDLGLNLPGVVAEWSSDPELKMTEALKNATTRLAQACIEMGWGPDA